MSVVVGESGSVKRAETLGKSMSNCVVLIFPMLNEVL